MVLRLNLGCGLHAPEGWVNIDRSPSMILDRIPGVKRLALRVGAILPEQAVQWPQNVVVMNVRKGLPYKDGSVDVVYSSHMLEHLYFEEAEGLLLEICRVLRPSGILRLALPDGDRWIRDVYENRPPLEHASVGREYNYRLNAFPTSRPGMKARLRTLAGAAPHYWQPTRGLVEEMLKGAGFPRVEERGYGEGLCPDLQSVEHRAESMFIEAVAPRRL